MFRNTLSFSFPARAKTNTIYSDEEEWTGRFVKRKYFLHFLGTVPTFGFRTSMVWNGGKQIFIKFWLSQVQKF